MDDHAVAEPWEPLEHLLALQTWDDEVGMTMMRMVVVVKSYNG